jgi:hypothetical protein
VYVEYEDRVPFSFLSPSADSISMNLGKVFVLNKFNAVTSSVPKPYAAVSCPTAICAKISLHAAIHKFYYTDGLT